MQSEFSANEFVWKEEIANMERSLKLKDEEIAEYLKTIEDEKVHRFPFLLTPCYDLYTSVQERSRSG